MVIEKCGNSSTLRDLLSKDLIPGLHGKWVGWCTNKPCGFGEEAGKRAAVSYLYKGSGARLIEILPL